MQWTGEITSRSNRRVKESLKLKKRTHRYEQKLYLGEGAQVLKEALSSGIRIEALFMTNEGSRQVSAISDQISGACKDVFLVTTEVMSALANTVTPPGILMVLPFMHVGEDFERLYGLGPLVFMDQVRDPGNLGTMIRAADAAGMSAVLVSKRSADLYNPKTVRATAGSLFHLPIAIDMEPAKVLPELKERGWTVVAADPKAGESFWEYAWGEKTVIVLGNEAWGIPEEDAALVDQRVAIPIFGKAESLNVASAAALLFYEIRRGMTQR